MHCLYAVAGDPTFCTDSNAVAVDPTPYLLYAVAVDPTPYWLYAVAVDPTPYWLYDVAVDPTPYLLYAVVVDPTLNAAAVDDWLRRHSGPTTHDRTTAVWRTDGSLSGYTQDSWQPQSGGLTAPCRAADVVSKCEVLFLFRV